MADDYTDAELGAFLDEALPTAEMTALEQRLRDDPALRARLADVLFRRENGDHSVGEIWRRNRLSCPPREELAGYVAGQLPAAERDYVRFHLESVGCRYCQANVDDLLAAAAANDPEAPHRRQRLFDSSAKRRPTNRKRS